MKNLLFVENVTYDLKLLHVYKHTQHFPGIKCVFIFKICVQRVMFFL